MAVQKASVSTSQTACLGLASFYRRYIPKFTTIAKPLHIIVTNLNQHEYVRRKKWMIVKLWLPECMDAFKNLKTALTTVPVLGFPDFALPFILEVDSSYQGVRVTFFQIPEGKEVFWLMLAIV